VISFITSIGQGIPGAKGNENAQASSDLVGPSLERSANEIPPAAIQVQRRKTKTPQPFIPPSMATLAQIAPLSLQTKSAAFASQLSRSFPLVPTQPQTASALLPLPQTASAPSFPPLSQTIVSLPSQLQKAAPLTPLPQKTALHIKWQGIPLYFYRSSFFFHKMFLYFPKACFPINTCRTFLVDFTTILL
jgi:hypothetical protein